MAEQPMNNLFFRFMSAEFKIRDWFSPPERKLNEAGIKPGYHILDFGCGTGSYAIATAEMVADSGKVYALDIHPLAIERVQKLALKKGLSNIETIYSDCATGLENESIDVVLLYDTFHDLSEPNTILKELHRVLEPNATLSFNDHHMKDDEILAGITDGGLFKLSKKGEKTYNFIKC